MNLSALHANETTYFAYGTLLELAEIRKHCPTAEPLGIYQLKDYQLDFAACGPDSSIGGCTLKDAPGNTMQGMLYRLSQEESDTLERAAGLDRGLWARHPVSLLSLTGAQIPANTFIIPSPSGPYAPPATYTRPIIDGAKAIPLNPDYIAQLESIVAATRHGEP